MTEIYAHSIVIEAAVVLVHALKETGAVAKAATRFVDLGYIAVGHGNDAVIAQAAEWTEPRVVVQNAVLLELKREEMGDRAHSR